MTGVGVVPNKNTTGILPQKCASSADRYVKISPVVVWQERRGPYLHIQLVNIGSNSVVAMLHTEATVVSALNVYQ